MLRRFLNTGIFLGALFCALPACTKTIAATQSGGYTGNPDVQAFIDEMVADIDGAQDHDLFLRVLEHTDRVAHIPRVLYHWRKVPGSTAAQFDEKSYAQRAGERAVQAAMDRRGIRADVGPGRYPGTYRVRPAIGGEPLVSIVIPFRDKPELLQTSIARTRTDWRNRSADCRGRPRVSRKVARRLKAC